MFIRDSSIGCNEVKIISSNLSSSFFCVDMLKKEKRKSNDIRRIRLS
jgi:hypothetical protein